MTFHHMGANAVSVPGGTQQLCMTSMKTSTSITGIMKGVPRDEFEIEKPLASSLLVEGKGGASNTIKNHDKASSSKNSINKIDNNMTRINTGQLKLIQGPPGCGKQASYLLILIHHVKIEFLNLYFLPFF